MGSHWAWYAAEGSYIDANGYYDTNDPKIDFVFFGWIEGECPELGYFRPSKLEQLSGSRGFAVERDLGFRPTRLRALMDTVTSAASCRHATGQGTVAGSSRTRKMSKTSAFRLGRHCAGYTRHPRRFQAANR